MSEGSLDGRLLAGILTRLVGKHFEVGYIPRQAWAELNCVYGYWWKPIFLKKAAFYGMGVGHDIDSHRNPQSYATATKKAI